MKIGVSSSCFYPLETEKSLIRLGELGVKTAEIFFNTPSELQKPFLRELNEIRSYYGMEISSFHPFMSFAEGYYIFSPYKRRFFDSLEMYKPFFEAAAEIGAKYHILHGSKDGLAIDKEEYAERFYRLNKTANEFSVCVAHENVVHYVGETPEFMAFLKSALGKDFKMTLDVKQARRSGADPFEFLRLVGDSVVHLHLSDCSGEHDCLPPKEGGGFDFFRLFSEMKRLGYDESCIIELYSNNFKSDSELKDSTEYLGALARKAGY